MLSHGVSQTLLFPAPFSPHHFFALHSGGSPSTQAESIGRSCGHRTWYCASLPLPPPQWPAPFAGRAPIDPLLTEKQPFCFFRNLDQRHHSFLSHFLPPNLQAASPRSILVPTVIHRSAIYHPPFSFLPSFHLPNPLLSAPNRPLAPARVPHWPQVGNR